MAGWWWWWLNDEDPPPRPPPRPRRRRTDGWRYRLLVALVLTGTHAYAVYLGYSYPWHG